MGELNWFSPVKGEENSLAKGYEGKCMVNATPHAKCNEGVFSRKRRRGLAKGKYGMK